MGKREELNETEVKVIKLICKELTAKEIAEKLGFSYRTVESYKRVIMQKTGVRSNVGIALYAVRHGIVNIKPKKS